MVPPFHGNISFNAHHSPMGAFFTFTCGHFGTRGGLGAQISGPANQDLYIGVKEGDRYAATPLRCLPFYQGADKGAAATVPEVAQQSAAAAANFLVEQADPDLADPDAEKKKPKLTAYPRPKIRRQYGWGSDSWFTDDFAFEIFTPFGEIKDPTVSSANEMRDCLLPAVIAELRVDNTKGTQTKTGFFALGFHEAGVRILDGNLKTAGEWGPRVGFAFKEQLGVSAMLLDATDDKYESAAAKPFTFMRWTPNEGLAEKDNPVHLLGSCPGIGFEVPPGKCYALVLSLGCYFAGNVTTRLEGCYLYTRYFGGLLDVLDTALTNAYDLYKSARARDEELRATGLNADQQFLIAHATRSYYGATQLLEVAGAPYWIVNEGEYCMINTLDLSVDHLFWELQYNPWVIKNLLENFVRYYSYTDELKDPKTGKLSPGGLSFCHDQGVHNNFSPFGRSSYELQNLHGCFSHMTMEQLCNWSLIAATYVAKTGDAAWARQNAHVIRGCIESMLRRCPQGVVALDSSRCGTGQEITTYDSLDASLGQARNNLYLAVKGWATFEGLGYLLTCLGEAEWADKARAACVQAAETVAAQMKPEGFIPAVFEPENAGYKSRILPAIEGVVYPLYWIACDPQGWGAYLADEMVYAKKGAHAKLLAALRQHTATLLREPAAGLNRFPDGGIKLSSTSNNSWASKIAIVEHVAREVFNLDEFGQDRPAEARGGAKGWEKSDATHTKWQTEGTSAYFACSDQMVKGVAIGSKYYPRIVTTILWMGRGNARRATRNAK